MSTNNSYDAADDPRITAYALGELEGAERAEVEALLERDPAARAALEEVRGMALVLERELATDEVPELTSAQRAAITREAAAAPAAVAHPPKLMRNREWFAIAAAAGLVGILGTFLPERSAGGGEGDLDMSVAKYAKEDRTTSPGEESAELIDSLGYGGSSADDAGVDADTEVVFGDPAAPGVEILHAADPTVVAPGTPDTGLATVTIDPNSFGLSTGDPTLDVKLATQAPERGAFVGALEVPGARAIPDTYDYSIVTEGAPATTGGSETARNSRRKIERFSLAGLETVSPGERAYGDTSTADPGGTYHGPGDSVPPGGGEGVYFRSFSTSTRDEVPPPRRTGESYAPIVDNAFLPALNQPLSTFSIDVDTASYANVRRFLTQSQRPPGDAVRIEELVNYFDYDYTEPEGEHPFAVHVEVGQSPWSPTHQLVRVGLQGRGPVDAERRASNLVFLLDVSGSMRPDNKLPLLKNSLHMLVANLHEGDSVAIVTYAGNSGLHLPATHGDDKRRIVESIDCLQAGGSTNGAGGIQLAYRVAFENFVEGGINRVILATDGDFNVGITDDASLESLIAEKAKGDVFLTVLGVGDGNLKDSKLEMLSGRGNGNYAYLDSLTEARKVLVDDLAGTLETIAKDVKIQVDFNPARVQSYRLIGYENRMLAARDFDDDTKDAGEIGAGHSVTALYEIVPTNALAPMPIDQGAEPSKYAARVAQEPVTVVEDDFEGELLNVRVRYKTPTGTESTRFDVPVTDARTPFGELSDDTRFAASVAAFGMVLRNSPHRGGATLELAQHWALGALGTDRGGYRAQFCDLVSRARQLGIR